MNIATQIYLRLLLGYGLPFGFFMSLPYYMFEGKIHYIMLIIQIVTFGGLMTWITIKRIKKVKLKEGIYALTIKDIKALQSELIVKSKSIREIFDALKTNELTKSWNIRIEPLQVVATTKITWSSWGEKIIISDLTEHIRIESKPILSTALFDNGNNRQNVLKAKEVIEEN